MRIDVISELMKLDLPEPVAPRDEEMGHLRHVGDDEATLDVLAESDGHRVVVAAGDL